MKFIHQYFGVLLVLSCLAGLAVPSAGDITPYFVILALAFIIFCSFFGIEFSASALTADLRISTQFWLMRYVLVPVVIFFIFKWISGFYAMVLLLSFILPAAVSSPAFSAMYGGKPDLSLRILVFSSFLAVITIPALVSLLAGSTVQIEPDKMLLTLIYTIVVPFLVHLPLRKIRPVREMVGRYNALFTLIGLSIIFILVTARNKAAIFEKPVLVAMYAIIALVIYVIMYVAGYFMAPGQSATVRRTFSISSGANNIGLGVTITALFFPGDMNIFFIVSQLIWVVMLVPLRKIFSHS